MSRSDSLETRGPSFGQRDDDPRLDDARSNIRKCLNAQGELSPVFQSKLEGLKESIRSHERAVDESNRTGRPVSYQGPDGGHLFTGQRPSIEINTQDTNIERLSIEDYQKLPEYRILKAQLEEQGLTLDTGDYRHDKNFRGPNNNGGTLEVIRNGDAELRDAPKRAPAPEVDTRDAVKQMREKMNEPKPGLMARLFGKK